MTQTPQNVQNVPVKSIDQDIKNLSDHITEVSQNLTFAADQRQAKIDAMSAELADRLRMIQIVNQFKTFDNFVHETIILDGKIKGVKETLTYLPLPTPPAAPDTAGPENE